MQRRTKYNGLLIFGRTICPVFACIAAHWTAQAIAERSYLFAAYQFFFVVLQVGYSWHFWANRQYEQAQ